MIGPRPCAYACAYVDPVFTSQSYNVSVSTRRTNKSVFLVRMLMSPLVSLAYTCACACYAYAYRSQKNKAMVSNKKNITLHYARTACA